MATDKPRLKPIRLGDLIAQLQKLQETTPDAFVLTEGCDCQGPCSGVNVDRDGYVVLLRDDSRDL
jgi:hypothetical protein